MAGHAPTGISLNKEEGWPRRKKGRHPTTGLSAEGRERRISRHSPAPTGGKAERNARRDYSTGRPTFLRKKCNDCEAVLDALFLSALEDVP